MNVLTQLPTDDSRIVWVTQHGATAARAWCNLYPGTNVSVVEQLSELTTPLADFQAAVVATAPHVHSSTVRPLLHAGVPTLCEKPLTLDVRHAAELEQLAVARATPLGVNLELHYACYLDSLVAFTSHRLPRQVAIQWLDPWSEQRYGETKYGDVFTGLVDDMFPHCWSLLRRITGITQWEIVRVAYNSDTSVSIELRHGETSGSVLLSRRADKRSRIIRIDGTAVLDFSHEPGWLELDGQRTDLSWETARPLTQSLHAFLEIAERSCLARQRAVACDAWQQWPLSAIACAPAVRIATAIAKELRSAQWECLQRIRRGVPVFPVDRHHLLIDLFVPLAALSGERIDLTRPSALQKFLASVERRLEGAANLQDFVPS